MIPARWKPERTRDLIRVGNEADGGYVISRHAIQKTRLLLSMGLSDDWGFEASFRQLSGARILCLDHTVTGRFWAKQSLASIVRGEIFRPLRFFSYRRFFSGTEVEHRRQKVGYDSDGEVSLATLLKDEMPGTVFLKTDIEGSEYRIFDDIIRHADKLVGLAMELHDIDLHRDRINQLIANLPGFTIVHLHANNYGGADKSGDPLVIEISMTRSDLVELVQNDSVGSPESLDRPNDPHRPDIWLQFAEET